MTNSETINGDFSVEGIVKPMDGYNFNFHLILYLIFPIYFAR